MSNQDHTKMIDYQKIATEGQQIYDAMKIKYEPSLNGKFLAIDIESKDVYLSDDGAKAVELARAAHPGKVFYVVKIGFETAETMARTFVK